MPLAGSIGKHGLQSLGGKQTAVVRRMPPPVHLPSLRSESSALGSAEAEASLAAATPPTSQPSWAPTDSSSSSSHQPPPALGPAGPQPLIPKLRDPAGPHQPRWMGDAAGGPSARDFPSLATAADPKAAAATANTDPSGPVLRPQKVGSWKTGGTGGAGLEEEPPADASPGPTPPNNGNGHEHDPGRRSSSPAPHTASRHFNANNGPNNSNFNPNFVSQRPPPPPNSFFRNSAPAQQPPPLMRGGYEPDYYEGPPTGQSQSQSQPQPQHPARYGPPPPGPGPDHPGPYPPDDFRGPPRHFDPDYGHHQPQPPSRYHPAPSLPSFLPIVAQMGECCSDRGMWSDEEERRDTRPPMRQGPPMSGRGDERADYPVRKEP